MITSGARVRPLKGAFLQTAIVKPKPIGIPEQDFEFIASAITEDKPGFAERIHLELLGDNQRQAINGLAHLGHVGDQKDLAGKVSLQRAHPVFDLRSP